jgi:hypothetical protein
MDDTASTQSHVASICSILSLRNIFYYLVGYLLLKFVYQVVYHRFFHPLKAFNGPFWASVTRLGFAWHNIKETEIETEWNWMKENGIQILFRVNTINR